MLVHVLAFDLEAAAELDSGAVDDWLELGLAREQLQLSQVMAFRKAVKGDKHDLGRFALQLVLQHLEVAHAIGGWYDPLTIEDGRAGFDL